MLLAAVALAVVLAAAWGASMPDAAKTQAGCACLPTWQDAFGGSHTGCTNPNNDPLGAWCAVDVAACPGYFSFYAAVNTTPIFFDYCGDVRERTSSGCLCANEWGIDGIGKAAYLACCAQPDSAGGDSSRKCRIDPSTCPELVAATAGAFDTCPTPSGQASAAIAAGIGANTTFHRCACVQSGWWYEPGASPAGGAPASNRTSIFGCANPDSDALGAWCPVDPTSCAAFAGYVSIDADTRLAFDYCGTEPTSMRPRIGCRYGPRILEWDQCGGKSNCTGWGCYDDVWPGACCAEGLECRRLHAFYYQCQRSLPAISTPPLSPSPGLGVAAPAVSAAAPSSSPAPTAVPSGPVDTTTVVNTSSLPALASLLADAQSRAPGATIYITLRVDFPFANLSADVGVQARFKSDVVAWLKGAAGSADQVYSAGVNRIYEGSVAADAIVVLTSSVSHAEVAAATQQLTANALGLYQTSNMQTTWGQLLSISATQEQPAALQSPAVAAQDPASSTSTLQGEPSSGQLGGGAIAAITICCCAFVALAAAAVWFGLRRGQGADRSKAAQLAYMNELTEAELDADDDSRIGCSKPKEEVKANLPTSLAATSTSGASPRYIGAALDPAFLPLPDGEGARRSSAGPAVLTLKQRRVSVSVSGSGADSSSGGVGGSGSGSSGGAGTSSPALAIARASGPSGSSSTPFFSATLSKLGSSMASYVSAGGSSAAGAEVASEKDH